MFELIHLTQIGIGLFNGCGPATTAMACNYYRPSLRWSVNVMASKIGNANGFSTFAGMLRGYDAAGVPAAVERRATIEFYERMTNAGFICTALIAAREIANMPYGYTLAHFVLVLDVTPTHVLIHDPLRATGPTLIDRYDFERAIARRSEWPRYDNNRNRIYPNGTNDPFLGMAPLRPVSRHRDLLASLYRNVDRVDALIGALYVS